jgi:hypothetical protein
MIRLGLVAGMLLVGSVACAGEVRGTWSADAKEGDSGRLQFSLNVRKDGNMGMGIPLSDFTGLTLEQVRPAARTPVHFTMKREAGTIEFDGTFRAGQGGGDFTFTPNPAYPGMLEKLGLRLDDEDSGDRDQFSMTLFDVSTPFIRSMQDIGYKVELQKYVEFRIFKVDPAYVKAMSDVGFPHLSADKLVETKIHDVSPAYIREMRARGKDLPLDEYVQSRIFQITPEFAAEMAKAGYRDLDQDHLVQFKIHDVSPAYIAELRKLGYSRIPADDLVAMRIHGVTPDYIRRVEKAGYHNVPIDKLVQMRIFDIDPEMVEALDRH